MRFRNSKVFNLSDNQDLKENIPNDSQKENICSVRSERRRTNKSSSLNCLSNITNVISSSKIPDLSEKFVVDPPKILKERKEETDVQRLNQRQKQIEYGKNTIGYQNYVECVPQNKRKKCDPQTPNVKQICSKRKWDSLVRKWRRSLHDFDQQHHENEVMPHFFHPGATNQCYTSANIEKRTSKTQHKELGTRKLLEMYKEWVDKKK